MSGLDSEMSSDMFNRPVDTKAETVPGVSPSLTQRVDRGERIGAPPPLFDKRKFHYDKFAGMGGKAVRWHVSKDDRMEVQEAAAMLSRIHREFGIDRESPEILEAFNNSLFFCHTINSGSVLQPGRSFLYVKGTSFPFSQVVTLLGDDIRRFFRAYADEVRVVNKSVLDSRSVWDLESVDRHSWLLEVATERGLFRYPELAHDSADKCVDLNPAERAALANSKQSVFANIVNSADRVTANSRMIAPDGFDTTTGAASPSRGGGN